MIVSYAREDFRETSKQKLKGIIENEFKNNIILACDVYEYISDCVSRDIIDDRSGITAIVDSILRQLDYVKLNNPSSNNNVWVINKNDRAINSFIYKKKEQDGDVTKIKYTGYTRYPDCI
jgi:hypothetical protein